MGPAASTSSFTWTSRDTYILIGLIGVGLVGVFLCLGCRKIRRNNNHAFEQQRQTSLVRHYQPAFPPTTNDKQRAPARSHTVHTVYEDIDDDGM